MKKIKDCLMTFLTVFLFLMTSGCNGKVTVDYSEVYERIQTEMKNENYETVLSLMNNEDVSFKEKTDWYYYDRALSIYFLKPAAVRYSLKDMKSACTFNKNSFEINYYLGKFNFETGSYQKSLEEFKKCLKCEHSKNLVFNEDVSPELWIAYINNVCLGKKNFDCNKTVKSILEDDELSENQKILTVECLLNQASESDFEQTLKSLEEFISDENSILNDYIKIKLIFLSLLQSDKEKLDSLLSNYDKGGFYIYSSSSSIVTEMFYKYLCFYYFEMEDGLKANNNLHIYQSCHYRPLKQVSKAETDLNNIRREFKSDSDFKKITRR